MFKKKWAELSPEAIKKETGIQSQYSKKITEIIITGDVNSMISLANYKGIGGKTLEKAFRYVLNPKSTIK
jgi:hypothetical protein